MRAWHIEYLNGEPPEYAGWCADLTEQKDGSIEVRVSSPVRVWRTVKLTIDEAFAVAARIVTENTTKETAQ